MSLPSPGSGTMCLMGSALTTIGLPVALGIIMFGLGLSLTLRDFARVAKQPKAVIVALLCQLVLLPAICFGLVLLFQLPPVLAVGMMMLAASPGGTTANLYSHLFRGDIALNISLTAINSVIAVITLPIITNLAIAYFDPFDGELGMQWAKAAEVFAIVLLPVALGMVVRRVWPAFADRMDKPVRIVSVIVLIVVIAGSVASNWELLIENVASLALITVLFCLVSLAIGYVVPLLLKVGKRQAIASSFEIGIHNATLAIVIAQTVLGSVELSLPAAVYGVLMFFIAFGFGFLIRDRSTAASDARREDAATPAPS
ncbi:MULTISPECIES: bile acid:sodium symporter family protein [unclassified Microbacterium]|uniref:bile acid:sodium symporter family protein n=1 Tax=unclassified Microbacterium TaxID=2609290 RepID=UPI00214BE820|nr:MULTISPECIES: bile acid:sodium symporter family protein [unclassified Microbacterium]MCR2783756.1 bile acid:sodium symporter family protein [Microbacterium sp. zg.B96]WIM15391.1 bile acid:sodium symporter family protein [Microbacterium sp. zg-B96]